MNWFNRFDKTLPIITAKNHATSSHGKSTVDKIPRTCCIFHFGSAMDYITKNYDITTILDRTPNFLDNRKIIEIKGIPNVCFVQGCYGSPAAVDLLETLFALGVEKIVSAGMCGGFSKKIKLGDVIIPDRILCEEGTSHHYSKNPKWIKPDISLHLQAMNYFSSIQRTYNLSTVTTDAIYRQTYYKESIWRKMKCVGVDMESSAILSVSNYYKKASVVILFVSDIHPKNENEEKWNWISEDVLENKEKMINNCIDLCAKIE